MRVFPGLTNQASWKTLGRVALIAGYAVWRAHAEDASQATIRVVPGQASKEPLSGRVLIFARAVPEGAGTTPVEVDVNPFDPQSVEVAGAEVRDLSGGGAVDVDAEAFPKPFSALKPGRYAVQAVLDRNHSYPYNGRGEGDLTSQVVLTDWPPKAGLTLTLTATVPGRDPFQPASQMTSEMQAVFAKEREKLHPLEFQSPALSQFWKHPTVIRGWVVLPPAYEKEPERTFPTVYITQGFGGGLAQSVAPALKTWRLMATGATPPMIHVFLDQSLPSGTHEFADSANNGPWGRALTTELIPELERKYRMDARATGRFVTGHSSGGWTALWLQTRYPKVFGGAWATAPDPSDFHDFTGTDLYAPGANVYYQADGSETPLVRWHGRDAASLREFAQLEAAEGGFGGQMTSFDWVFSPAGKDGKPVPMFDRVSGKVDPVVAAYWAEHYDIANLVARDWKTLQPDLDGKIHVVVGDADTFHLEGAAHRFKTVLDGLGAKSEFRFLPGRSHFDLYREGSDADGLTKRIARAMYALARPGSGESVQGR